MNIYFDSLYGPGTACRICEHERGTGHEPYCAGNVIEGLQYEIKYDADESGGSVTGVTLDECIEKAASELLSDCNALCEARYVFDLVVPDLDTRVEAVRVRLVEKWRADMAEERRLAAKLARSNDRAAKLAALEALRPDLLPEAYERRKAEIG